MIVELPYPPRVLSPNGRAHRMVVARAKAAAKRDAFYLARAAKLYPDGAKTARVHITFCPPQDGQHRDLDNAIASAKAQIDGVAMAIAVDDSRWEMTFAWGDPVKLGAVRMEITRP